MIDMIPAITLSEALIDGEMRDAIRELELAHIMFNQANDQYRINEAIARINAAEARIDAINHERKKYRGV